jgi:hypothetical protein
MPLIWLHGVPRQGMPHVQAMEVLRAQISDGSYANVEVCRKERRRMTADE